jgi:hypothetical protein
MNEQKSFIHYIVEAIDRYRIERRARASEQGTQSRTPSRLRRFLRWLTPNGGTLLLVVALIATAQVWAQPLASPTGAPGPSATTINYQGRLSDSGGDSIDNTNPGLGMTFSLYAEESGGSPVWTETHANVPVSDGLFSVRLGSVNALSTDLLGDDLWLGIQVGSDPEMTPREKLSAVPYAMVAGEALTVPDGSIGSAQIVDGAVGSDQVAGNAINSAHVADGAIQAQHIDAGSVQSQNMAPTIFQGATTGEVQVTAASLSDDLVIFSVTVDCPVDANYLIFFSIRSRSAANLRVWAALKDENFNEIESSTVCNSHTVAGLNGSQTASLATTHFFSAGTHTINVVASAQDTDDSYIRTGSIIAVPFAVAQ